jgi:hypothetical protein
MRSRARSPRSPAKTGASRSPRSFQITLDLYGHLMPGNESEAAAQLDAYMGARTVKRR